jgi:hypothetical protein
MELYCSCVLSQILFFERGDCERKKRKLQQVCCKLYRFILMDNKKEGPGNLSGGHIPHWVNHVYSCLYCIMYLLRLFMHLFFFIALRSYFFNSSQMGRCILNVQKIELHH